MSRRKPMLLLNCARCDDVLQLVDKIRFCTCELASGRLNGDQPLVSGAARVLTIDWEFYDGLVEGTPGPVSVLPRDRFGSKGSL